jgi:hypothetical protein
MYSYHGEENMTLLKLYIDDTLKHYVEPERRGVQKGKEIGPFRGRFEAALYSMYGYEKKEIAELSNITYPFMRKLWVDKNFIELREVLMDQFVLSYLFFYLNSGSIKVPGSNFCENMTLYQHSIESAFEDVDKYSDDLKQMINKFLITKSRECSVGLLLESSERLIFMLSKWNEPVLNKRLFLSELKHYTVLMEGVFTLEQYPKEQHRIQIISFTKFIDKLSGTL